MMHRILFIINPISGGEDKQLGTKRIEKFCQKHHYTFEIYTTTGNEDASKIKDIIDSQSFDIVAVYGGDGTINKIANVLIGRKEAMAVLPGGSANGMARNLFIPNDLEQALKILHRQDLMRIDTLLVDHTHPCIHLGDLGFNAKIIQHFDQQRGRGKLGYARSFFRCYSSYGLQCIIWK